MNRDDYEAYLERFSARDYDGVLAHFTDDCEVVFAGYCFKGSRAVRDFYSFFHRHVDERITVTRFVEGPDTIAIEATVRLEGLRPLAQGKLEAKGLGRLVSLEAGQVVELPQFVHYHLRDGKFHKALCAVFEVPQQTITSLSG